MAELGKSSDEVASSSRQVKLRSLIMDDGEKSSKCGYCMSSTQTSIYHGLWAYRLTVDDYQDLLDRGWRLSGMYLYQPNMRSTSCPQYAIRLKASCFIPSKEQRRVLNRMHRYLDGSHKQTQTTTQVFGINDKEFVKKEFKPSSLLSESRLPSEYICSLTGEKCYSHPDVASIDEDIKERIALAIKIALVGLTEEGHLPQNFSFPEVFVKQVSTHIKAQLKLSSCRAVYTSNLAFSIAAGVCNAYDSFGPRKTRLQKKQNLDCKQEDEHSCFSAVLAELLASKIQSLQILQGLTIKACKGHLNFFSKDCQLDDGSSMIDSLCQKKNNEVMPAKNNEVMPTKNNEVMPASGCLKETRVTLPSTKAVLDISLKRSEYDPEEFSLYKRYQVTVHNDKPEQVTESSYKKLLVDTPLIPVPPAEDGSTPFCGFGSFHQQYRIDGQLVAVAVVDVLPRCLSSKYLFWDPDFSFLSLGKYTALYEINLVQELCTTCISLEYYYLGYYIHFCPKMRYKAAYRPSELLCPEKLMWVPYDVAKPLLEKHSYTCLSKVCLKASYDFTLERAKDEALLLAVNIDMKDVPKTNDKGEKRTYHKSLEKLLATETMESKNTLVPLNYIPLRHNGRLLSFQQMEWRLQDTMKDCLERYLDRVGSVLAARMEYLLA